MIWVTIITGVVGVIGGATGSTAIQAFSRRKVTKAETQSIVVDAANALMTAQQAQMDRSDVERVRLEQKVEALQTEVNNLHVSLRSERLRCDTELHEIRLELRSALITISSFHPPQNRHSQAPAPADFPAAEPTGSATISVTVPATPTE